MKGKRFTVCQRVKALRKDMLTGMLLHVIKTGLPVNRSMNLIIFHLPVKNMNNIPIFFDNIDDFNPVDGSFVRRIKAG
jgi:hypothetical protein